MAKRPDWEAIESAYRAGLLSIRAIGEKYGVNHATIIKRAKNEGWQRDLTEKVKSATLAKVTKAVTTKSNHSGMVTDGEIIDQASDVAAEIILEHRVNLSRWRGIASKLGDFLDEVEFTEENHSSLSRTLSAGVDAQIKIIKAEREAYNIDSESKNNNADTISSLMDDLSKE